MYLEKRKEGKRAKYYLVHSFREGGEVKKIRRYLGSNLSAAELEAAKKQAEQEIRQQMESVEIFNFSLTKKQVERLNKYDEKIRVHHLQPNWSRFTEQFAYNTNAIEGSTVRLNEVPEILHRKSAKNSEELETKGVAKAVEFIRRTKEELSLSLIKKLHKLCFEGSKPFAGEFRKTEVVIRNAKGGIVHEGAPASHLHYVLNDMIGWHRKNRKKFKPLVMAAIMHNQFEHIHPFQDGNGRVGRLLLNFILIKNKYPPINISLEDRAEYYSALQEYSKRQNLKPTILFLIKQYKKTLRQVSTKKKK